MKTLPTPAQEKIEIFPVNHLPIVKAFADKIGLVDIINTSLQSEMAVDPGTVILGMVEDTLSGRTPLYRLGEFYSAQDTELLLGKKINPAFFADHNVGRVLDAIHTYGSLKIFSAVAQRAVRIFNVPANHVSFDTTSISVYGDYRLYSDESEGVPFKITNGYSKDHRPDLKQFMISMLCVNRTIPIFGKTESGNASDKEVNNAILTSISKYMAEHGLEPEAFIYIADSAMVTEKNLKEIGDETRFISRLPATYKECAQAIKVAIEKNQWQDLGILAVTESTEKRPAAKYKAFETQVTLHGKTYRAVVVHSSSHDKRRQKRIERELASEHSSLNSKCKEAAKKEFFCRADAEKQAKALRETKSKYYQVEVEIEEAPKYKRGRPKAGGDREISEVRFRLTFQLIKKEAEIEKLKKEAGCFVMITNVPKEGEGGYTAEKILKTYKDQYGIERNFGFLKDPVFVNSIFLKKVERIEALGLVLLLSLLIWRLIEHALRNYIKNTGQDLPGWDKKRTQRPTSFMMMTKFFGLMIIKIGKERRLNHPLSPIQREYLTALGVNHEIFLKPGAG